MSNKAKKIVPLTPAQQAAQIIQANTEMMRRKSAQYAYAQVNGEADVLLSIPIGTVSKIETLAEIKDLGLKMTVTIFEAKFGSESFKSDDKQKVNDWLNTKRAIWQNAGKAMRDRAVARAKLVRLYERMSLVLDEIAEIVSDDTAGLLCDATQVVAIAVETIAKDGTQKTIAEVKRGA